MNLTLKNATETEDGIRVTYQRGDGTEFSYLTMCPERYGFPAPAYDPLRGILARLEKAEEELQNQHMIPVPDADEEHVWQVPDGKNGTKEVRVNKLATHQAQTKALTERVAKLKDLYERATEAFNA